MNIAFNVLGDTYDWENGDLAPNSRYWHLIPESELVVKITVEKIDFKCNSF